MHVAIASPVLVQYDPLLGVEGGAKLAKDLLIGRAGVEDLATALLAHVADPGLAADVQQLFEAEEEVGFLYFTSSCFSLLRRCRCCLWSPNLVSSSSSVSILCGYSRNPSNYQPARSGQA